MKTLVLVACLLAVVYAANEKVTRFHENVATCSQELNKPPAGPEIDEEGKYILEKGLADFDNLISDEAKRNQAKDTVRKCYETLEYKGPKEANTEQTMKGVQCALPTVALIDKP
ncbi:hypothetical protein DBV15_11912 [Temnothorax longispinosus]|uniref:Ant venom allergen Sol i 2/4 domain-containing protein n=1 Tax=Temnothorax longispinosus TaxID=300112 RepID=A0A4S2KN37_9HYME|nr:hypothetical protein DBV15_11912 [Temnothorax longispinosus]